jgi:hypothetical protein
MKERLFKIDSQAFIFAARIRSLFAFRRFFGV